MRNLYAMVEVFAPTLLNVLILGETGVGKDLYAAAVHRRSRRRERPYLQLNCAALPESMLDGELFGYERGAFTGAVHAKPGLFEAADGGTVFLDEIGEMPLATQAKLLHVLESGQVLRLGSIRAKHVDVRFVSATNRSPRELIGDGRFRPDLYFRINGITVTIPPLRDRRADIAPLARAFAARAAAALGGPVPTLTAEALSALERYPWPGNVRELRSVIDRATVFCSSGQLGHAELELAGDAFVARAVEDLAGEAPPCIEPLRAPALLPDELRALGRQRVVDALAQSAGNQTRAARSLGISRFQLMRRLVEYGVPRPRKP